MSLFSTSLQLVSVRNQVANFEMLANFLHLCFFGIEKWMFPKIGVHQNGWFIMENPIKMDDLGVPLFLETPKCCFSVCKTSQNLTKYEDVSKR